MLDLVIAFASMTESPPKYIPKPPPSPATRPKRAKAISQLHDIQKKLYDASQKDEVKDAVLAQLARAWCELEDTKRVIQMKPAPKPVDVAALDLAKRKRSAPAKGFTETPAEQKGKPAANPCSQDLPETGS